MKVALLGVVLVAAFVVLSPPSPSDAATVDVIPSQTTVEFKPDGKDIKGTLSLLNTTDSGIPIELFVKTAKGTSCGVVHESKRSLAAGQTSELPVIVSGCSDEDALTVEIKLPARSTSVDGKITKESKAQWNWLWCFAGSAAIALGVILAGMWVTRPIPWKLPGLKADYDFTKSWASNATLVASAFAGVFGKSDVLEAVLGDKDKALTALMTVSSAIAASMVVAAPVIMNAFKSRDGKVNKFGFLTATLITLSATGGQLGVLIVVGAHVKIGHLSDVAIAVGAAAIVLLIVYSFRLLCDSLKEGAKEPAPSVPVVPAPQAGQPAPGYPTVGPILLTSRGDSRRSGVF